MLAVAEVLALFYLLRIVVVYWLLPQLRLGARAELFLVYAVWIAVPRLLVKARRDSFDDYGLRLSDAAEQGRIARSLFIPFALQGFWASILLPGLPCGTARKSEHPSPSSGRETCSYGGRNSKIAEIHS